MKKIPFAILLSSAILTSCGSGPTQEEYDTIKANYEYIKNERNSMRIELDNALAELESLGTISPDSFVADREMSLYFSYGTREGLYTGQLRDGLPNGEGTFSSVSTDGISWTYRGQWSNGHCDGQGSTVWSSGQVHIGEYASDKMHGTGLLLSSDGEVYKGNFTNGTPTDDIPPLTETIVNDVAGVESQSGDVKTYTFSAGMYSVGKDIPQGIYDAKRLNDYSLLKIYYDGDESNRKLITDSYNNLLLKNGDAFEITGEYSFTTSK